MPTVAILVAGAGTGPAPRTTDAAPSASSDAGPALVPVPVDNARVAPRILRVALPEGVAPEKGLQVKTILAARAVSKTFPEILDIGGVRADALKWHPNGMAIDVMIPNYTTPEGKALGDRVDSVCTT